jgi:hypothetical protein
MLGPQNTEKEEGFNHELTQINTNFYRKERKDLKESRHREILEIREQGGAWTQF